MSKQWISVLRAADAAARWHVHQRRKGAAAEPYINHLLEVATLVAEAKRGSDPDLVIGALLHDAAPKRQQVEHAGKKSKRAKLLKSADNVLPGELLTAYTRVPLANSVLSST